MAEIDRRFGRAAFGADPANYDAARPAYPDWVFKVLAGRCGLGPGAAVFEIGAGTGTATRRLLELGADPLIAIEPDARLAAFLAEHTASPALQVVAAPFETAPLPRSGFDLGVCATAFHWLEEDAALARIAALLRPGGWWAMWWNVFYVRGKPDPFHVATRALLAGGPASPSRGAPSADPFSLDVDARRAAVERAGAFEAFDQTMTTWELPLSAEETVALYATYSDMIVRPQPDRGVVLAELGRIAAEEFGGHVVRNVTTVLYTARRVA